MVRALLAAAVAATVLVIAPPAAAQTCPPGAPPMGAASRPVDVGGQPATLWVSTDGFVGVTGFGEVQVPNAGALPLQALLIDAQQDGNHQLIVSNGRGAHLYAVSECQIVTFVDWQGEPFLFDLENLRGHGTGVGCSDLGEGRHLVGLQALLSDSGWTVRRTQINLDGATATVGPSDTVTAASSQDPAVTTAQTISCGDLTITEDGVQQP